MTIEEIKIQTEWEIAHRGPLSKAGLPARCLLAAIRAVREELASADHGQSPALRRIEMAIERAAEVKA